MNELLQNPAIQSGILPGILAFVIGLALSRFHPWSGFAVIAGFWLSIDLTIGFQLDPLTSTRKIIVLSFFAAFFAVIIQIVAFNQRILKLFLAALVLLAIFWMVWPVLERKELAEAIVFSTALIIYSLVFFFGLLALQKHPVISASSAILLSGFSIGFSALLGASALLGQSAIAIGAAATAFVMVQVLVKNKQDSAYILPVSSGLVLCLLSVAMVVYAKVPWYCLIFIAMIPWLSLIRLSESYSLGTKLSLKIAMLSLPAILSVVLTWQSEGPVPY
ncbi:MAG: hypothetical protein OEY38_05225 [Gammaproteobacteria bacterium]|nr:hypothetical protein [Gammaproteobacteria bacterium]